MQDSKYYETKNLIFKYALKLTAVSNVPFLMMHKYQPVFNLSTLSTIIILKIFMLVIAHCVSSQLNYSLDMFSIGAVEVIVVLS